MKHQISNRWTGAVIFEGEYETLKDCVEAAVKNRANLDRASLVGALGLPKINSRGDSRAWLRAKHANVAHLRNDALSRRMGDSSGWRLRATP